MKNLKVFSMAVSLLLFAASLGYAMDYVQAPPLADVTKTPVSPCGDSSDPIEYKLITWGGDIATIYANGNSRVTKKGSIFDQQGLNIKLVREDDFKKQIEDFLSCKSPVIRGTMGMINMALEALARDYRTEPKVIYQLPWSVGGEPIVVTSGISPA